MAKNIFTEFPTYPVDQLSGIFINGISPESMTHDFEAKRVKHKQYKECIRDHEKGTVFCVATLAKRPKYRFRVGQEVDVVNPYNFNCIGDTRAVCVGTTNYYIKGLRFTGYLMQYI
ncbi:TPA: hypothetical protein ORO92_002325 [Escherichia coli]|nr:hypothetical protein [Escherichia coli]